MASTTMDNSDAEMEPTTTTPDAPALVQESATASLLEAILEKPAEADDSSLDGKAGGLVPVLSEIESEDDNKKEGTGVNFVLSKPTDEELADGNSMEAEENNEDEEQEEDIAAEGSEDPSEENNMAEDTEEEQAEVTGDAEQNANEATDDEIVPAKSSNTDLCDQAAVDSFDDAEPANAEKTTLMKEEAEQKPHLILDEESQKDEEEEAAQDEVQLDEKHLQNNKEELTGDEDDPALVASLKSFSPRSVKSNDDDDSTIALTKQVQTVDTIDDSKMDAFDLAKVMLETTEEGQEQTAEEFVELLGGIQQQRILEGDEEAEEDDSEAPPDAVKLAMQEEESPQVSMAEEDAMATDNEDEQTKEAALDNVMEDSSEEDSNDDIKSPSVDSFVAEVGVELREEEEDLVTKPSLQSIMPFSIASASMPYSPNMPYSPRVLYSMMSNATTYSIDLHKELAENRELDFDENPSELYLCLQGRDWDASVARIKTHPEESTYWVTRHEEDGKLRWRLLPLHAAIIFGAPVDLVKILADAFPEAVAAKDDQGMIPLHLSYHMGSPAIVVEFLLDVYPASMNVKDKKGRTPLVLAETSKGPNKVEFIRILEQRARALENSYERVTGVPGHKAMIKTYEKEIRFAFDLELQSFRTQESTKQSQLEEKIKTLEKEMAGSEEATRVFEGHVAYLEKKLAERGDTEARLAARIAEIDKEMKQTMAEKNDLERRLNNEKMELSKKNTELRAQVKKAQADKAKIESGSVDAVKTAEAELKKVEKKLAETTKRLAAVKDDHDLVCQNASILEKQLKKKIAYEHTLVDQVSSLARQLALANRDNETATLTYTQRVRSLQKERDDLRETVSLLTWRLINAVEALESMQREQTSILETAKAHEREMESVSMVQASMLKEVALQTELVGQALRGREQIAEILQQQDHIMKTTENSRSKLLQDSDVHSQQMVGVTESRKKLLTDAEQMKSQITHVMERVAGGLPRDKDSVEDKDLLVDKVVKNIMSLKYDDPLIGSPNEATLSTMKIKLVSATINEDRERECAEEKKDDVSLEG